MECNEVNAIIDGHRRSSLSAAERRNLDAHLACCGSCAASYAVAELLAGEALPGARAELFSQICERISRTVDWQIPPKNAAIPAGPNAVADSSPAPVAVRAAVPARTAAWPPARRAGRWPVFGGLAAAAALLALTLTAFVITRPDGSGTPEASQAVANGDAPFLEGRDYAAVPGAAQIRSLSDRVTVWLFYMWSCLHCYHFEAELTTWLEAQDPGEVELVRVPVQWNALAGLHARAFFAADLLGVADAVGEEFYAAIHERQESVGTRSQIAAVFARAGVDRETFMAAFESPEVDEALARAREVADQYGIDSTPSIVIDGIYRTNPGMAGTTARMLETVEWLIAQVSARNQLQRLEAGRSQQIDELLRD